MSLVKSILIARRRIGFMMSLTRDWGDGSLSLGIFREILGRDVSFFISARNSETEAKKGKKAQAGVLILLWNR